MLGFWVLKDALNDICCHTLLFLNSYCIGFFNFMTNAINFNFEISKHIFPKT